MTYNSANFHTYANPGYGIQRIFAGWESWKLSFGISYPAISGQGNLATQDLEFRICIIESRMQPSHTLDG